MPARVDGVPSRGHAPLDDHAELHALFPQPDLAGCQARHVQEVIHQMDHVPNLPLGHCRIRVKRWVTYERSSGWISSNASLPASSSTPYPKMRVIEGLE